MIKRELREIYLKKRLTLSEATCSQLSRNLCDYFFGAVDLSFIRVLHIFLPIKEKNEPDTWMIVDRVRREFPHVQLSVPRVAAGANELENFNFEGLHQIQENAWGIPEPKQGIPTELEKIDMILVPMLVADLQGDRVGYGKGYYDRFISEARQDCKKVGLSLFDPVEKIDDVSVHDQRLDLLITPTGSWSFDHG